jgi:D-lactate dehydrogenase (cytochrome)
LLGRARRDSGDRVVAAEYVSRPSLELVLRRVEGARDPFAAAHAHYLLLELASVDDASELRSTAERILAAGLEAGEIEDGALAASEAQRVDFWHLRERVPEAERREGGALKHDVAVRISRLPDLLARVAPALRAIAPHRVSVFGHIGDGNLHLNLLPPEGQALEAFRASVGERLTVCVHDAAAALGGSFSAEHGVGVLKVRELERYEPPAALALMRTLKRALDPGGLMNPGKVLRSDG